MQLFDQSRPSKYSNSHLAGYIPGFISFFSDIPGPRNEILAQVGDDRVSTHHLGAEDVTEDTVVVVEVDSQQLSLSRGKREEKTKRERCEQKCITGFL